MIALEQLVRRLIMKVATSEAIHYETGEFKKNVIACCDEKLKVVFATELQKIL